MKYFYKFVLCIATIISGTNLSYAGDHPEAHFGRFGIQYHTTLSGYTEYIGKTVVYMPEYDPSYDDNNSPFALKGKINVPFVITKITGTDSRMTFHMVEKNGKTKVKMIINNRDEYYSYGKYTYCISDREYDKYTVPLVVIDEVNRKKSECVGKVINDKYEIIDFIMDYPEKKGYPEPCYLIKNKENNATFTVRENVNVNMLGHIFKNPLVKANYEVIEIMNINKSYRQSETVAAYKVKNSETGEVKEVVATFAEKDCFKDDLSGQYQATLIQVERPSDASNRYGDTETIVDDGVTKFSYVDDIIDIVIFASSTQFNFVLKNVSNTSIKVIWNEAVFVDYEGNTSKIMHIGTKYSQREEDQPATTIIKGAKVEEIAVPTKNVRYSDLINEWITDSMFPSIPDLTLDPIRLMLPIQIKDTINEYIFVFDVKYSYNHPERLNL